MPEHRHPLVVAAAKRGLVIRTMPEPHNVAAAESMVEVLTEAYLAAKASGQTHMRELCMQAIEAFLDTVDMKQTKAGLAPRHKPTPPAPQPGAQVAFQLLSKARRSRIYGE